MAKSICFLVYNNTDPFGQTQLASSYQYSNIVLYCLHILLIIILSIIFLQHGLLHRSPIHMTSHIYAYSYVASSSTLNGTWSSKHNHINNLLGWKDVLSQLNKLSVALLEKNLVGDDPLPIFFLHTQALIYHNTQGCPYWS